MGRTKRNRIKKKNRAVSEALINLSKDDNLVNLHKWLKQNQWQNETALQIRNFSETGRGVTSPKSMHTNDILIKVPYDLMITFTTIQSHFAENEITLDEKLTMQEFLALFLILERNNENSSWKAYINSLPSELPDLPWLKSLEEINLYPLDLQIACRKNLENFETSVERVRKSIGKQLHCVSLRALFKWAYVLVNTRAVYVDPNLVWGINNSMKCLLLDEPSQALCPFLDMFNHHFSANTEAFLTEENNRRIYALKTLTSYRPYNQIMISYGPHDNTTLLTQYGFFIPGNIFDIIKFEFQEVKDLIKFSIDTKKYKFLKNQKFDSELYIGQSGVSFNMKALFYTVLCDDIRNCSVHIFSDSYPENFEGIVRNHVNILLSDKLKCLEDDLKRFEEINEMKSKNTLIESYLKYKIMNVIELLNKYK